MTPSYAAISSVSAGLVAEQSSARKSAKYSELAISHISVLIAMESFGPIYAEALTFLSELGCHMSVVTGDLIARKNFPFSMSIHGYSTF